MHDLCLLCVIVKRDHDEQLPVFFREHGINTVTTLLCQGTAGKKLLDLLGLEETEKELHYAMTTRSKAKRLLNSMVHELGLDMPGQGMAFTVPLGSIGGASSLDYFTHGQDIILGEVKEMPHTFLYELIIAIANRGHVDEVMNAARSAGVMGGTVLHAKGTNPFGENKFFGMSIADEKEMVLILSAANQKNAIMRAIMDKAGVHSPAHTVMFTLPVESVAGLRSVMEAAGVAEE
ncbi:MAG: P-II family nitrogen regulator [Clostridia bacterium]|nr:P-II family nitrogen regulator [Clostridia bacterium]